MLNRATVALVAVGMALGATALAQNFNRAPAFGTWNLRAGFEPDPRTVQITAGGTRSAAQLGPGCLGTIADAPDVRLNYTAGNFPLYIFAQSRVDVTLVVNLPDGRWACNDDFDGTNPGLVFQRPQSGQYDIWLGVYQGGSRIPAILGVSEVPPRR